MAEDTVETMVVILPMERMAAQATIIGAGGTMAGTKAALHVE